MNKEKALILWKSILMTIDTIDAYHNVNKERRKDYQLLAILEYLQHTFLKTTTYEPIYESRGTCVWEITNIDNWRIE